jgi:hypothetical protein
MSGGRFCVEDKMAFSDSDFVKLNLPAGASFNINVVVMTVDTAVTNALADGGGRAAALAILWGMLESDNVQSETIGKYSYMKWKMRGSDFWRLQAVSASGLGVQNVTPRDGGCWPGVW